MEELTKLLKENNKLLYIVIKKLNNMSYDDAMLSKFVHNMSGQFVFSNVNKYN